MTDRDEIEYDERDEGPFSCVYCGDDADTEGGLCHHCKEQAAIDNAS